MDSFDWPVGVSAFLLTTQSLGEGVRTSGASIQDYQPPVHTTLERVRCWCQEVGRLSIVAIHETHTTTANAPILPFLLEPLRSKTGL